jgi:cytohesin
MPMNAAALHGAADRGQVEVLSSLLDAGLDIDTRDAQGRTPLMTAVAQYFSGDAPEFLVNRGADLTAVDSDGRGVLEHAFVGDQSTWDLLIEAGVPVPAKPSVLVRAVAVCDEEIVEQLLEQGVDPNTRDQEGRPVLCLAAADMFGTDVMKLLLRYGADPGLTDTEGKSPLDYAEEQGFSGRIIRKALRQRG